VTDVKVLDVPADKVSGEVKSPGGIQGTSSVYVVNHNADNALVTLRYRLKNASFDAAEDAFDADGQKFNRGSFIIRNASASELGSIATELGLQVRAVASAPTVKTHPVKAARI